MKRQKMKEKTKFKHIKILITMVAQKVYSAEHKTRMDTMASTWLIAVQNEKNSENGKIITWHKPLNDLTEWTKIWLSETNAMNKKIRKEHGKTRDIVRKLNST